MFRGIETIEPGNKDILKIIEIENCIQCVSAEA